MFKKAFSTKINVAATFANTIWTALLGIVFVPLYLNYIGIEAYGLIGIFSSIQSIIALLDFGISPTFNREIARLSALENSSQEIHDIKRTLEIPNWITATGVALILAVITPIASNYWIQPKDLSIATVTQALLIMGINIAIQFSVNFYIGGLLGLQKQFLLSIINIICGTLRSVGALIVLAFVSPTIQAFLIWQGIVIVIQLILTFVTLKLSLPEADKKGRFNKDAFYRIWRYAAGLTGISVVSLILTQTDKIVLTRMIDLKTFGYYTLAVTIASIAISFAISAITQSVFPQFSRLVSVGDEKSLSDIYHRSCQIVSVLLFSVTIILVLFSYQVLIAWTNKVEIADNAYLLVSLVAVGTGLNGLIWLPYYLQLAHGWTKLAFYINVFAIIILIPLMIFGTYKYGAIGGALCWIALNAFYVVIMIQLMHRRILKGEQWRWYFKDLLPPFLVALTVAGIGKLILPVVVTRFEVIIELAAISMITLAAATFSTKASRNLLFGYKKYLLKF